MRFEKQSNQTIWNWGWTQQPLCCFVLLYFPILIIKEIKQGVRGCVGGVLSATSTKRLLRHGTPYGFNEGWESTSIKVEGRFRLWGCAYKVGDAIGFVDVRFNMHSEITITHNEPPLFSVVPKPPFKQTLSRCKSLHPYESSKTRTYFNCPIYNII